MNANPQLEAIDEEVRKAAYLLYLASGCVLGRDRENWLAAQAKITSQPLSTVENTQSSSTVKLHFPLNANASRGPFDSLSPFENRN